MVQWNGEMLNDHIHDTINRDYYISCRSSCGGVRNGNDNSLYCSNDDCNDDFL